MKYKLNEIITRINLLKEKFASASPQSSLKFMEYSCLSRNAYILS